MDKPLLTHSPRRDQPPGGNPLIRWVLLGAGLLSLGVLRAQGAPGPADSLAMEAPTGGETLRIVIPMIFIFVLATLIGMEVIRNVSRLLHTPLMSLTNAISAVVIVGAILVAGPQLDADHPLWIRILGLVAITAASVNIVSGFLITSRMLKMFKSREPEKRS